MNPVQPVRTLLPYALFAATLFALTAWLESIDGLSGLWWHKIIELPLVLYLYWLFRQLLRGHPAVSTLAALPILISYVLLDGYYLMFGRVFRLSEINELPELLDVLPRGASIAIIAAIAVSVTFTLLALRKAPLRRLTLGALPLVVLIASAVWTPEWFLRGFTAVANGIIEWSDEEHVRWNGRFTTVLYQEARRNAVSREIATHLEQTDYDTRRQRILAALQAHGKPRNVHMIVYEGFVDPTRLEHLRLNRDPIHPALRELLPNGTGYLSRSPVFGGYTAQAEFEILCGVPAMQRLGTIEFNVFSGRGIHCVPDTLRALGYVTIATNGYKPNFFNAMTAYRGLGFEEIHFPYEYVPKLRSYFSIGDVSGEKYMFDRTLFEQNLAFIRERLNDDSNRPILNYLLTIFGHYPFWLNEDKRPRIIHALNKEPVDSELLTIANQTYYRSEALAWFIKELQALDPEGIVLVVSDHLPPLKDRRAAYERLGYLNGESDGTQLTLLAVYDRGHAVNLDILPQYEIPTLLYWLLTDRGFCDEPNCAQRTPDVLLRDYLQLMARATRSAD
ncbi:MAG: LTA synthase family protein [Thiotrichales bacterium]